MDAEVVMSRSTRRRRRALAITDTDERLIAAAANIGESSDAEERIEHAGRDRHAGGVVDEREEQVLPDVAHGRAARAGAPARCR